MEKKLYRSRTDKKLCGVCGGLAKYLNMDATIIRLIVVLLTLAGCSGLLIYIIAALVIPEEPLEIVEETKNFCLGLGFKQVVITTPQKHDQMIAYTSQLAHVVSNAYVKSPGAQCHHGFSAGSYLDLTRVARLNEVMWTELFLHNSQQLCIELNSLIEHLQQYSKAIANQDAETLQRLLKEGRELKEATDPDPEY